ncbi:hypothetical protein UFOVP63_48 [uncultured Caudovirales phage]|uniref:Uncharacterized protein n=1 Tax=uncultured Caudovirales phage TaxID=2100421 RepID=A0A6J5KR82_9CAUD|nr:hypothetical protein UFOVP63_48 [uncultured Caudovirales phage]
MPTYAVRELQTIDVTYTVEAPDEITARQIVSGLYCDDYDIFNGLVASHIMSTKLITEHEEANQ